MKSPLERAARALCELAGNPPGASMNGKPLWMDYLPEVRAVVRAIREPSGAMVAAGYEAMSNGDGGPADAADCHRAMIDALLEERK